MSPIAIAQQAAATPAQSQVVTLLLILFSAAVVAVLARRLRLATIPGYLIIGAIVGPSGLRLIDSSESVKDVLDLAIVLLMFTIGLGLDIDQIRSGMVRILAVGLISTVGVSLALWPLGMLFGLSAPAALVVGMGLSMSSTAVAIGVLQKRREMHLVQGRLTVGISVVQDLMSIGVLALLPALALWAGVAQDADNRSLSAVDLVSNGLLKIGGLGTLVAVGRYVLPRLLGEAARSVGTESLLVLSAFVALGAAVLTAQLGFGPALGAFVAGFMLASTPFRYQIAGQLVPLRDLFMSVFFTVVGMSMHLPTVAQFWWIVAAALVLVLVVKVLLIGLSAWMGGATAPVALKTAVALGQAGEFSLVVISAAVVAGIIDPRGEGVVIAVVVLSLVLASPLYELCHGRIMALAYKVPAAHWIGSRALRDVAPHPSEAASPSSPSNRSEVHAASANAADANTRQSGAPNSTSPDPGGVAAPSKRHVIIAGFGVVGRNLAEHFGAAGIPYSVVELNSATVRKQRSLGRKTVYGDVANPDVLREAGIEHAEAVVLTIPDDEATLRACQAVRAIAPTVFIAARTSFLSKAIAATELGADYVTIEEVVTAQDMAKQVMSRLKGRFSPSAT
ncbi:MAG: cation:proton antiporter [Phycisphaeraceae bacterium]|nr:cation:proton antiporter [Phycisphaeraceae bacterium]